MCFGMKSRSFIHWLDKTYPSLCMTSNVKNSNIILNFQRTQHHLFCFPVSLTWLRDCTNALGTYPQLKAIDGKPAWPSCNLPVENNGICWVKLIKKAVTCISPRMEMEILKDVFWTDVIDWIMTPKISLSNPWNCNLHGNRDFMGVI